MDTKRVLIVDDEAPLRFLLSKKLSLAGFDVLTAADGRTALEAAAAERIDAIVLDVMMPGMDGFEVCRALKAGPRTARIPIIFLSASISGDFRRRAFKLGAADFLAKPFQVDELPVYLQSILSPAHEALEPAVPGCVTAVAGSSRAAGSAVAAVRLAESAALSGGRPVMLIDLELPAGSIGARLQLSGGPNVRFLLHDTGEPVTSEVVGRVSQRLHGALEVIPAPYSPSTLIQDDPDPRRLAAILDYLATAGYAVVLHLGATLNALNVSALSHATAVVAVTEETASRAEQGAFVDRLAAMGANRERITPAGATARPDSAVAASGARARTGTTNRTADAVAKPVAVPA